MTRNSNPLRRVVLAVLAMVILIASGGLVVVKADDAIVLKIRRTIKMNDVGNADISLVIKAPTNVYTLIKTQTPNFAVLLRQLGAGRHWAVLENIDGKFNDLLSTIEINYQHRSVARVADDGRWVIPFEKGLELDLIDIHDGTALFNTAANSPYGVVSYIVRVETPAGSNDLAYHKTENTCTYQFEPTVAASGAPSAKMSVDARETIMSCLAKCYSNEQFTFIWAARSRFENTGAAVLDGYRVRSRIAGLSSWSRWSQSAKVFPGQTVVDAFYPVFDLDKINSLTGSRPAMLEIEYEYVRPDGRLVKETDSRQITVLGRNETIFTGLAQSEILSFEDRMEYLPAVLASFTTPNDPVITQLAGRISGRANGAAASYNNDDAVSFLKAMYSFLEQNKVAYQSPPTYVNGTKFGQHIKYGRDVLQNHAGTCIDLAILWASTCEAVGLQSTLILIPGHCFPAVRLPDGQLVALEATCVGKTNFDKAFEIGMKELEQARNGQSIFVNITEMRRMGIQCLDLPNVPHNFLAQEGYDFTVPPVQEQNSSQTEARQQTQTDDQLQPQPTPNAVMPEIVGQWGFRGEVPNGTAAIGITLREDGGMALYAKVQFPNGRCQEIQGTGSWSVEGTELILADQTGTSRMPFSFQNEQLAIYFETMNTTIRFQRLK